MKEETQAQESQAPEFPKKGTSQNGNMVGYSVEVRYNFHQPGIINGMLLGKEWKTATFEHTQPPIPGVPIGRPWNERIFSMLGLYDYAAAQALRWWFHANAEAAVSGALCLESRIVAHSVKYSFSEEAISAHMEVKGDDRTNFVPDWNTEKQPRAKAA